MSTLGETQARITEEPKKKVNIGSMRSNETHWIYDGIMYNAENEGGCDWAYGCNRLCTQKTAKIHAYFKKPQVESDEYTISFTSFGPQNIPTACEARIFFNGKIRNIKAIVPSCAGGYGRTTHSIVITKEQMLEDNHVTVQFVKGEGVLFLAQFDIEA